MEDLASHGFVVISVGHPYGSVINYEDGSFITPRTRFVFDTFDLAANETLPLNEKYTENLNSGMGIVEAEEQYYIYLNGWKKIIQQWEDDNYCVLEYFKTLNTNRDSMFYERFDFQNIGVIGHSLGGYTAGNLCAHREEVKACVFYDTDIRSDYFFTGMQKPSLFIYANSIANLEPYIKKNPYAPIKTIAIKNVSHYSFMEQWLLAPYNYKDKTYNLLKTYKTLMITYKETRKFLLSTLSNK